MFEVLRKQENNILRHLFFTFLIYLFLKYSLKSAIFLVKNCQLNVLRNVFLINYNSKCFNSQFYFTSNLEIHFLNTFYKKIRQNLTLKVNILILKLIYEREIY